MDEDCCRTRRRAATIGLPAFLILIFRALTHTHTHAHLYWATYCRAMMNIMLSVRLRRVSLARARHDGGGVKLPDTSAGGTCCPGGVMMVEVMFLVVGWEEDPYFPGRGGKVDGFVNEIERSTGYDGRRTLFLLCVSCSAVHTPRCLSCRSFKSLSISHSLSRSISFTRSLNHSADWFCNIHASSCSVVFFFLIEIEIVTGVDTILTRLSSSIYIWRR